MTAQRTPGPWYFNASQGRVSHRIDPLTEYVIADLENDCDANGPLIAASPNLLAALEAACNALIEAGLTADNTDAYINGRKAIAQAGGEGAQ